MAPGALPPDQGSHSACADQGSLLAMAHGGQVWACPGTFAQGDFATLCAADLGSHVCGQDPHDESLLMLLDCDSLSGFYLTQLNLTVMKDMVSMMYQGQCDSPPGGGQHAILGCGTTSGVTQLNSPDCHYLHDALICPAAGDWSCTPQKGLDDVTYRATTGGGVLCCSSGLR